jgi:hypothetical protein
VKSQNVSGSKLSSCNTHPALRSANMLADAYDNQQLSLSSITPAICVRKSFKHCMLHHMFASILEGVTGGLQSLLAAMIAAIANDIAQFGVGHTLLQPPQSTQAWQSACLPASTVNICISCYDGVVFTCNTQRSPQSTLGCPTQTCGAGCQSVYIFVACMQPRSIGQGWLQSAQEWHHTLRGAGGGGGGGVKVG